MSAVGHGDAWGPPSRSAVIDQIGIGCARRQRHLPIRFVSRTIRPGRQRGRDAPISRPFNDARATDPGDRLWPQLGLVSAGSSRTTRSLPITLKRGNLGGRGRSLPVRSRAGAARWTAADLRALKTRDPWGEEQASTFFRGCPARFQRWCPHRDPAPDRLFIWRFRQGTAAASRTNRGPRYSGKA